MSFNRDLKPFRTIDPHDIVGEYATTFTGDAGKLVKVAFNNLDAVSNYNQTAVGASYGNVKSNRWAANSQVTKTEDGDGKASVLGMTLQGTTEKDNHGRPILGFGESERWATENEYATSGMPVQIITRGFFRVATNLITGGVPAIGSGLAAGAEGKFKLIDESLVTGSAVDTVIGKCLSASGSRQDEVSIYFNI